MRLPLDLPPAGRVVDVVGIGENSLELVASLDGFPEPNTKQSLAGFAWLPGGQTATALVACARLGSRTRYIGVVGDDDAGRTVARVLEGEGVAGEPIVVPGSRTRFAVVLVDRRTGARTILEGRDLNLEIDVEAALAQAEPFGRVLLADATSAKAAVAVARRARSAAVPTVVDVDRPGVLVDALMAEADILICPERFAREATGTNDTGDALARLQGRFSPAVAVATLGELGSLARVSGQEIRTHGFRVDAVDTTGAGDAFRAGLVTAWLRFGPEADINTLLEYANATAALNCRQVGAQTALPSQNEVDSFVTAARRMRSK